MHQNPLGIGIFIYAIMVFFSCNRSPVANGSALQVRQIDSLIKVGKKYPNSNLDSLLATAKKLDNASVVTGNKKALVYGELFTSEYYWLSADHKTAMQIAVKCLNNTQKWNIYDAYPIIYSIMGNLHKENTNYALAFEDAEKGLRWARANKDTGAIISLLSLRAMFIHTHHAALHGALNDTSINMQLSALRLAKTKPTYEQQVVVLDDNTAQYYVDNGDYKSAINYGEQGAELAVKLNRQRSLTYSYTWLGMAWYGLGDKQKALHYLNSALQIAHHLKQPYREMEIHEDLYHFYYKAGDYKTAIAENTRSQQMRDSLKVNMNAGQLSELQVKYELTQKDQEIAKMNHAKKIENRQIIIISAISVLFIIFFIILFLQYRIIWHHNHQIKKSNEKKDQALVDIAFIQSHELRKPLASILGLVNVIKAHNGIVEAEILENLEKAAKELDEKVHIVTNHVKDAD